MSSVRGRWPDILPTMFGRDCPESAPPGGLAATVRGSCKANRGSVGRGQQEAGAAEARALQRRPRRDPPGGAIVTQGAG